MKKISFVLFFLLFMTCSLDVLAQRRGGTTRIHDAGPKLIETDTYELYENFRYDGIFCDSKTGISVCLVLKVGPDYVITDNDDYRRRFEKEILPIIKQRCSSVTRVSVLNYVKGVILDRNDKEHSYDDRPDYERPLAVISMHLEPQGGIRYEPMSLLPVSLASLRQRHALEDKGKAQAKAAEEAAEAAKQKLANAEYSSDGKLNIADIDTGHKKLFLQIYNEEFIELSRTDEDQNDYLPYVMYSGLIQGYSDLCSSSLSASKVSVDIYDRRYKGTDYGPFVRTEYWERYLAKTVYMEPKYEAAYRSSVPTFLKKMNDFWNRERRDGSILHYYAYKTPQFIQLAKDSRQLISNNGCKNASTLKFIDNLHKFITGSWDTRTATGGYKYTEQEDHRTIKRFYTKVPATFSPEFPPPSTTKEMHLSLNDGDRSPGLKWVTISPFRLHALAGEELIKPTPPEYVMNAVNEKKYFIVECYYFARDQKIGGYAASIFYWNANGPLPSAAIQNYVKSVIQEPRKSCPVTYPGR